MTEKHEPLFKIGQIIVPVIVSNRNAIRGQVLEILTSETGEHFQVSYICRFHEIGKGLYGSPIVMKEMEIIDFNDERFKKEEPKKDD